jgi:Ser/Thr protein kinase RdoA (MazF antagonist)
MDHTKDAERVSELVGWPTAGELKLMEGGLTGKTFGLRRSSDKPIEYVVRLLSATESKSFEHVTRALAGSGGVTPSVVAACSDYLVTEFISDGKAATVSSFGGVTSTGNSAIEAVGHITGKLHAIPLDAITIGGEESSPRDDLAFWMDKAEKAGAGLETSLGLEVATRMRSEVDRARARAGGSASSTARSPISSMLSSLVAGHGDLHPGNILLRPDDTAVLVDLEHCGARTAGEDLAYFFAVWGDLLWMAGFAPSATQPYPYPSLEARRTFAAAYINSRGAGTGTAAGTVATAEETEELLFEVERNFARTERLRLMIVWALIAKGDSKHMLAGAVSSFLPHLQHSLELLSEVEAEASAGTEAGAGATRADIVRRGLIVMAAERANSAATAEE